MDWSRMISVEGLACCVTAAILYVVGIICDREAEGLTPVTRVNKLKGFGKVLPLVVAVSGWVGSDTPIKCEYSGLWGVIVKKTEMHHFLKRNDKGKWGKDETSMPSDYMLMGLLLPYQDDGTGRVRVVGACYATGLPLTLGGRVFEESGQSPDREKLEEQGLKMLQVEKIENILRIDRSLTVVAEAIKELTGTILIQPPYRVPFYVSGDTVDELIATLALHSSCCKYASMGLTVVGVCFLAKHAFQYIKERRHLQEMRKRLNMGNERAHRLLDAAAKEAKQEEEGSTKCCQFIYYSLVVNNFKNLKSRQTFDI
ncbi:hypothetical protein Pfo_017517 [Paulownia fortunei]|nr:hypothetical protein Pfo_017517 [Paulownia fortunei]